MKYEDLKNLSTVEINKKIREIKTKMFEAKMKNAMGQMTDPIMIRKLRRDVARLKTAMTVNSKAN
ncbi:MAG: 50S ribosomal protein L29 [Bdellovibrionales bacterium]|nr:50S ribosomal protein L29 [Bdellovibrionales bacterium]